MSLSHELKDVILGEIGDVELHVILPVPETARLGLINETELDWSVL